MARFHALRVVSVEPETREAVVVTLRPEDADQDRFRFQHGQYLTLRHDFEEHEVRRCYSICSGAHEETLKIGIKRVDGGAFSRFANETLKAGDIIEAMPPRGSFTAPLEPAKSRFYLFFAGGSGITPILSILKTVLALEPGSSATLVYANRHVASIMFHEELQDLKNVYMGRLQVVHVLNSDVSETELFSGRLDREKLEELFSTLIKPEDIDLAFLCGPHGLMQTVREGLLAHGVGEERIRQELFKSDQPGRLPSAVRRHVAADTETIADLTLTLDGTTRQIKMLPGQTVLEAAHAHQIDAPYSCCSGVCSTCRGKVLEGEVEMAANHALEDDELRDGYILTCQSRPITGHLVVSYDT